MARRGGFLTRLLRLNYYAPFFSEKVKNFSLFVKKITCFFEKCFLKKFSHSGGRRLAIFSVGERCGKVKKNNGWAFLWARIFSMISGTYEVKRFFTKVKKKY